MDFNLKIKINTPYYISYPLGVLLWILSLCILPFEIHENNKIIRLPNFYDKILIFLYKKELTLLLQKQICYLTIEHYKYILKEKSCPKE